LDAVKDLETRRGVYRVPHLQKWSDRGDQPSAPRLDLVGLDTKIAAIGSCFADRATRALAELGLDAKLHPAGLQFNTYSILQEFQHLFGEDAPYSDDDFAQVSERRWVHPFRKAVNGKTYEDALKNQREIDARARMAYRRADLVIITLGLIELWQRKADQLVAAELPPLESYEEGLYEFRVTTTAENLANLEATRARIRTFSDAPILITVSPVPLAATFRDAPSVVANCESKSVLRAATADFVAAHDDVHYFHSFELVPQWQGGGPFYMEDARHISPAGVSFIIDQFIEHYGTAELEAAARERNDPVSRPG